MTNDQKKHEQLKYATGAVADIEFLLSRPEFQRFMDGFKNRADALADEILHHDMTQEAREAKRQFRLGIMEVLGAPVEIRNRNFAILKKSGVLDQ